MAEASPTPEGFRDALAAYPTGVTVVTAVGPSGLSGATANAVTSLSLDPPMMLACLDRGSRTLESVRAAGRFGVNALAAGQEERIFALLKRLGFYLWHAALERHDGQGRWEVLDGLREFREHLGGELSVTLLREIGRGEEVHVMDEPEILRAIAWLRQREAQ